MGNLYYSLHLLMKTKLIFFFPMTHAILLIVKKKGGTERATKIHLHSKDVIQYTNQFKMIIEL